MLLVTGHSFQANRRRRSKGFALLITITLLAFLVLLLVSLASLTRVETQVAGNNQQLASARQNALMALNIAVGQLQVYAGPDQRVTTPAGFGTGATSGVSGLVAPVPGAKQWVSVWGNSDAPGNIYSATPKPVLLNWLVSGNTGTNSPDVANDGHITSTISGLTFQPSHAIPSLSISSKATDALTINGKAAVLLVGSNTAGITTGPESEPAVDRYVVAPLMDIQSTNVPGLGGANTITGRYAYWVGDEGVKAQYNLRDERDPTPTNHQQNPAADPFQARYQLLTPARNGIELLTGQSTFPINDQKLDRIVNASHLTLADSNLTTAVQRAEFATLTTGSWGVLANSQSGGLRTDLTHVLNQSPLGSSYTGRSIIPEIAGSSLTPAIATADGRSTINPAQGPTWDTLKSFYELAALTAGAVEIRPSSATQTGIAPVIVGNRLIFDVDVVPKMDGTNVPRTFYLIFRASFTVANPYSFKIKATNGLDFSYAITTPTSTEWGVAVNDKAPFDRATFKGYSYSTDTRKYFPIVRNTARGETAEPAVLGNVRFRTPANLELNPGEVKTYVIATDTTSSTSSTNTVIALSADASSDGSCRYNVGLRSDAPDSDQRYEIVPLVAEALSLQMALGNSAALNGSLAQPQTGALQIVTNLDLSAANGPRFSAPFYPKPMRWTYIHKDVITPLTFMGYGMSLALPVMDADFYQTQFSQSVMQAHRAYADYNLAALNFALPPIAKIQEKPNDIDPTGIYSQLETVPPFARQYIIGPSVTALVPAAAAADPVHVPTQGGTNHDAVFNKGLLSPRWGSSTTTSSGKTETVLYDAPRAGADGKAALFSIGQLQHADLTGDDVYHSVSYQPRYAVGNSSYNIYVPTTVAIDVTRDRASPQPNNIAKSGKVRMFDQTYLLNATLWDGYFFSTLLQDTAQKGQPANARLAFSRFNPNATQLGIGSTSALTDLGGSGTFLPEKAASRYMMIKGAFNINSTSKEAWKAVLSGSNNMAVNSDSQTGVPFARSLNQPKTSNNASSGESDEAYSGFRRLTPVQIDTLAGKIVEQIRKRGPFLSLGHFVNRSLGASSNPTSLAGALGTAINDSGINTFTGSAATTTPVKATSVYAANGVTDLGNRATGIPGWLSQADILQTIGPILSARSDTFTIRTYGEVVNTLDSTNVISRAWCEAVVQRFPDYTISSISLADNPNAVEITRKFGRQFRIVSFRWLSPNDI